MSTPAKSYLAGGQTYFYPGAGDPLPPGGADVHLININDGMCLRGKWDPSRFHGWAPLPMRDKSKEAKL